MVVRHPKAILGLALLVGGVTLLLAFWPLASLDGAELAALRGDGDYPSFAGGEALLVRMRAAGIWLLESDPTKTIIEIEDSSPTINTSLVVLGDARHRISEGTVFYATTTVSKSIIHGDGTQLVVEFIVASPEYIQDPLLIDLTFVGIAVTGFVLTCAAYCGSIRKPG